MKKLDYSVFVGNVWNYAFVMPDGSGMRSLLKPTICLYEDEKDWEILGHCKIFDCGFDASDIESTLISRESLFENAPADAEWVNRIGIFFRKIGDEWLVYNQIGWILDDGVDESELIKLDY